MKWKDIDCLLKMPYKPFYYIILQYDQHFIKDYITKYVSKQLLLVRFSTVMLVYMLTHMWFSGNDLISSKCTLFYSIYDGP